MFNTAFKQALAVLALSAGAVCAGDDFATDIEPVMMETTTATPYGSQMTPVQAFALTQAATLALVSQAIALPAGGALVDAPAANGISDLADAYTAHWNAMIDANFGAQTEAVDAAWTLVETRNDEMIDDFFETRMFEPGVSFFDGLELHGPFLADEAIVAIAEESIAMEPEAPISTETVGFFGS